jgi:hypothetical protein
MNASLINSTRDVFNQTQGSHQHGGARTEAEPNLPWPACWGQIGAR